MHPRPTVKLVGHRIINYILNKIRIFKNFYMNKQFFFLRLKKKRLMREDMFSLEKKK